MISSPADLVDENGVLLNKLGISDSEQLSAVEYETTRRRAAAILNGEALAHLQGFGIERLQAIHRFLFDPLYEWAGNLREMASAKDIPGTGYTGVFTAPSKIADDWKGIEQAADKFIAAQGLSYEQKLDALMDIFVAANNSHPFLEGNGRALQMFMTQLALEQGIRLNFSMATDNPAMKEAWNHASAMSGVYGVLVDDDTPGENWELSQAVPPDRTELAEFFRYIASESPPRSESALREQAISPDGDSFKSERAPWGDFPSIIRNGDLGTLQQEPEYQAAKNGDSAAALALVNRLLTNETVSKIKATIGDRRPLLVPVLAVESAGNNKIPLAMAEVLAERLGLETEIGILQREKIGRTNSGADHRLAFNPTFTGAVKQGQEYLILDDTLTMGGTIAALRGFIENRGGKVIAASVMTAHPGAVDISVKPGILQAIEQKHGSAMDDFWKESFGYGIECLTQGEAGHLRKAPSVDAIRTRISAARDAGGFSLDAGTTAAEQREQQRTVVQGLREAGSAETQTPSSSPPKILINVIGSPGAGKTYWAQAIAQAMGGAYVSEYATHLIRQGRAELLADQVLTTGGQMGLLLEGFRNSNIVVSDSPGALGFIYCSKPADLPAVRRLVEGAEKSAHVITVLARHNEASLEAFSMDGRVHNREQSLAVQQDILLMLDGKKTFEGTVNGEPFFFTPKARQYITVERGASLENLVKQIKQQIASTTPSPDPQERPAMTIHNIPDDSLEALGRDLKDKKSLEERLSKQSQGSLPNSDEALARKYSSRERFPEIFEEMLDTGLASNVTITDIHKHTFSAGPGAKAAVELAQKLFYQPENYDARSELEKRIDRMIQAVNLSEQHKTSADALRGITVLREANKTADDILGGLGITDAQRERVKRRIQNEWTEHTDGNDSIYPLSYALRLAKKALSDNGYEPDAQLARSVMIQSLIVNAPLFNANIAEATYTLKDRSRQLYGDDARRYLAAEFTKKLSKVQGFMTVLQGAMDATSTATYETEKRHLLTSLRELRDTLTQKGGESFMKSKDAQRLSVLIKTVRERPLPITRPSMDNVDEVYGFNVVDWREALSPEMHIKTIKAAADIAKKYGVNFKHQHHMIVGKALDGQDAFFRNNYDAPTAVVRMLLPKEQFKKLCEAHSALATSEAAVAKAGPLIITTEAIQAYQTQTTCHNALLAVHKEALVTFQKAANEHHMALFEDSAGYFERLGKSQFGVPVHLGQSQEGVDRLVDAHERVLKGICLHDVDTEAIDAYQPAADAAFHETNCGVPKSAPFSAMPFPLEDGAERKEEAASAESHMRQQVQPVRPISLKMTG